MNRYYVRRLLMIPVLLFGITVLDFVFISIAPGDPITAMIDPSALRDMPPEFIEARREALGLNRPVPVRYVAWVGELAQGNLGYSYTRQRPVAELLGVAWRNSVSLVVLGLFISSVLGILLGVVSALRPYSVLDYGLTLLAFLGPATPSFFISMALIYIGALRLGWFPTSGLFTPGETPTLADSIHHLILPVLALSLGGTGGLLRYTRSSLLEVIHQDYITTARSKGLHERRVILRHALRNALLPTITIIGLNLPGLVGGAFIIETIFNIPGIGSLLVDATIKRDYPVMMGGLLLTAVTVLFSTLITDMAYAVADPRIRYES
jgi:peptide/nickel transport system permease protein